MESRRDINLVISNDSDYNDNQRTMIRIHTMGATPDQSSGECNVQKYGL